LRIILRENFGEGHTEKRDCQNVWGWKPLKRLEVIGWTGPPR